MAGLNCISCQYFVGDNLGICRRFPSYQHRHQNEWCGEHLPKNKVIEDIAEKLIGLPEMVEPPKRGRPKKC